MAGSLPLKNDVQLVTQLPQSRRQALDVLSAAESVLPISDSEVTCGHTTRPATLNSSATSSSNSTDFSSSSSSSNSCDLHLICHPSSTQIAAVMIAMSGIVATSIDLPHSLRVTNVHHHLIHTRVYSKTIGSVVLQG